MPSGPTIASPTIVPIVEEFPSTDLPTLFADGVVNISFSQYNVKIYLFRNEPSYQGSNRYQVQAIAQIVMPLDAFAASSIFYEGVVAQLVQQGTIKQTQLDEWRQMMTGRKS